MATTIAQPPAAPAPTVPSTPAAAPTATVLHGDCVELMRTLPDNSVDSIVTDPPYEISFMGKGWDGSGVAFSVETWAQALRVLKPGGHLIAFGGTRTWHRLAVAIEDAGFEIRDQFAWLYGSGFPKSLDVSKAIDKAAGAQREVVGTRPGGLRPGHQNGSGGNFLNNGGGGLPDITDTAPATPEAAQWAGWGTALKPAFEPAVIARKPLAKGHTVAANVLAYGTGALNVDATRINPGIPVPGGSGSRDSFRDLEGRADRQEHGGNPAHTAGRWPANILLDTETATILDGQSGVTKSKAASGVSRLGRSGGIMGKEGAPRDGRAEGHSDEGGASRFFYVAKAPKRERPIIEHEDGTRTAHPTVKPLALMRYLVRMVTPPGGTVLEPFAGSGATVEAALLEGFNVIACELTGDYLPLVDQRIARAQATRSAGEPSAPAPVPAVVPTVPVVETNAGTPAPHEDGTLF